MMNVQFHFLGGAVAAAAATMPWPVAQHSATMRFGADPLLDNPLLIWLLSDALSSTSLLATSGDFSPSVRPTSNHSRRSSIQWEESFTRPMSSLSILRRNLQEGDDPHCKAQLDVIYSAWLIEGRPNQVGPHRWLRSQFHQRGELCHICIVITMHMLIFSKGCDLLFQAARKGPTEFVNLVGRPGLLVNHSEVPRRPTSRMLRPRMLMTSTKRHT